MTTLRNGFVRLADLDRVLEQIEAKRRLAQDNGADPAQLGRIDSAIGELKAAIAQAAVAEAEREVRDAVDEAELLEAGRPRKPVAAPRGPGDPEPDDDTDKGASGDDDSNGGGGGGGGGGGASGGLPFGSLPPAPGRSGDRAEIPAGQCIYVRSEDTVWAWDRYTQQWKQQDFASPILSVETVGGGILVVARHGACLFDAALGEWLLSLTTSEVLVTGAAAATVPGISVSPDTQAQGPHSPPGDGGLPPVPLPGTAAPAVPVYPMEGLVPPNPELNPELLGGPLPSFVFPPSPAADPTSPPVAGNPPGFGGTPPNP